MLKEGHGLSSELLLTNYALTCVVLDEMINKGVVEHLQVRRQCHPPVIVLLQASECWLMDDFCQPDVVRKFSKLKLKSSDLGPAFLAS